MNKSFRSVWNASKQAYVAAAETVSAKGKPSSSVKVAAIVGGLMGGLLATGAHAQTAPAPTALPTGGQVSAGQARIGQSGANLLIQQSTDRSAINWNTFNVGKDAKVQFEQPNASSVTLNRVLSNDPSQIFGQITANGQVILTNPSGVFFGKDARVDVGGLMATTHGMSDADFMAGKTRFERNGSTASVVNEGELKAALGGYIALLAPEVRNQGAVIAQMGTVALAAGEAFDLKFDSNNRLTSLRVEASQIKSLVDNRLAVQAPGGLVIISAQSLDRLVGGVVNNSGNVEATGLQQQGGRIVLSGSTRVQNAGSLNASSTEAAGKGGSISVQGESIDLQSSSRISATGPAGGGTVLVGGNWQGSPDPLLQATAQPTAAATTVNMASGATIDASATQNGDGGKVVLWSEKTTDFAGRIAAQGAGVQGAGGNAEVSGKTQLNYTGQTNLLGSQGGSTGNLLLDPYNLYITTDTGGSVTASGNNSILGVSTLTGQLASANVTVSTGSGGSQSGTIGVMTDITSPTTNNLTLTADGNVVLAGNVSMGGQFTVNAGGNFVMGTNLNTAAGVTIAANGGFVKTGSNTSYLTGNITTVGTAINIAGPVQIANFNGGVNPLTLSTGGGNISLGGAVSNYSGTAQNYAVTMASNLYDGVTASTVAGSTTDIYLSYSAGTGLFLSQLGLPTSLSYLLVGGGGGGGGSYVGAYTGGGGGGGGVATGSYTLTGSSVDITVGTGGTADPSNTAASTTSSGGRGTDSSLGTIYVGGGGGGGHFGTNAGSDPGNPGTSGYGTNNPSTAGRVYVAGGGGGGAGAQTNGGAAGGTGSTRTGGTGASYAAGNNGGGGGGATGNGSTNLGGNGVTSSITGTSVEYGKGGGGWGGTPTANTGGGAGANGYSGSNGVGASGTAIIKYTVGNATASAASALKLSAGTGSVTLGSSASNLSSLEINAGAASSIAGAVSGASSTLTNSGAGVLTLNGAATYTGSTAVTTSGIVFNNNATPTTSGFTGAGTVTIQPTTSFTSAFTPSYTYASTLTGLTLGKSGNTQDITVGSAISIAGPISIYAGNINLNANLTSTLSGAAILAKASGNITSASSTTFQTNNGNITFWSDSDATNGGNIFLSGTNSLLSTGGKITLAGGAGTTAPTGVAAATATAQNVGGDDHQDGIALLYTTLNSGGGDISIQGQGFAGNNSKHGGGVYAIGSSINSGGGIVNIQGSALRSVGATNGLAGIRYGVYLQSSTVASGNGNLGLTAISSVPASDISLYTNVTAGLNAGTGSLLVQADSISFGTSTTITGNGSLTVQPYSTSFSSAFTWPITNMTLSGNLTSLTLGKPGNTADITVSSASSIAGPISIYGGNINLNANLTSTLSGAAILAKATGNITQAANVAVKTNAGDMTYWADSDNSGSGGILINNGGQIDTRTAADRTAASLAGSAGGHITLAGGLDDGANGGTASDGRPDGYAANVGSVGNYSAGLQLGTSASTNLLIYSGGGDIMLRGKTTVAGASGGLAVQAYQGYTIDAGQTGNITMFGNSAITGVVSSAGFDLATSRVDGNDNAQSYIRTRAGNIAITGTASGGTGENLGVSIDGDSVDRVALEASAGGSITVTGTGTGTGPMAMRTKGADYLANSGNISLIGAAGGIQVAGQSVTLGKKAGTNVTASASNVLLRANSFTFGATTTTDTTGTLTVEPYGNSFTSALTWPITNSSLGSDVSGLTLGKPTNTANITVSSATSIAGPISIYGGNITLNANLTSTLSGAAILAKASGDITSAASTTFQTNNGNITLWSDSDNSGSGSIALGNNNNFNSANGSTASGLSGGGKITLAGGLDNNADGIPDGFAISSTTLANGIKFGTSNVNTSTLDSGGGDVLIKGKATHITGPTYGISSSGALNINSGTGSISLRGESASYYGVRLSSGTTNSTDLTFISAKTSGSAIAINGTTTSASSYGLFFDTTDPKYLLATGGGNITINGTGTGVFFGVYASNLNILATTGAITADSGTKGLRFDSSTFGQKSGTAITSSSSNITLTGDRFEFGAATAVDTTGTVTVNPYSTSFSSALTWPISNMTLSSDVSGLTLGKSGNTADITVSSATSIAGPISIYGGNIAIDAGLTATGTNTISLTGTGNVTDGASGYVSASNLALLGGNVTLDNASNAIGTLAANGVSGLTYVDSNALTLGTVGSINGVSATGAVAIGTLTGDLTLAQNLATTNTTSSALALNAGISTAAGTSTGGNVLLSGTPTATVSVGSGGTAKLYSGSISGSTGLTALVGSGSGRFRYNSDEAATNFTTALGTGLNAIYRERPSASGTISSATITYGDASPTFTLSGGALQNGDSSNGLTIVSPNYSTANKLRASGTAYAVSASGLTGLGYSVSGVTNGALTVNTKALTVTGLSAADKVYDATTTAVVSGTAALQSAITNDVVSLTGTAVGNFNSKDVATANTVAFTGISLTGTDADNYTLTQHANNTTARITAKALTAAATASNKVYDGSTTAAATLAITSGLVGSETVTATGASTFNTKDVATANLVTVNSTTLANGTNGGLASNYSLAAGQTAAANITAKALTATATASNKVYDGSTTAAAALTITAGLVGTETVTATGASTFNTKDVATANLVTVNSTTLANGTNGGLASNYSLAAGQTAAANITAKALTATATASNKVYDGSTTAAATLTITAGLVGTETVTATGAATFNSKDVASANLVTVNTTTLADGTNGGLASNYSLAAGETAAANITAKALTVNGLSSADKVYDATTTAVINGTAALQTAIAAGAGTSTDGKAYTGDTVSLAGTVAANFNSKDVATANTVAFTGLSLTGAQASNYTLTQPANDTTARITAKALTVNGLSSADKVYDATTVATVNGSAALQTTIASGTGTSTDGKAYSGDTVSLAGTVAANFNSKDVATANSVTFTGLSLTGAQAGNYTLTGLSDSAPRITRAALTVIANNDAKFVTTADPTFTLGYSGFVTGETSNTPGVWATAPTVSVDRTNILTIARGSSATGVLGSSGNEAAGTYANALVPTGAVAPNYQVTAVKGSYTIVPAEQLLVRVQSASTTYGTAPSYTVTSAKYFAPSGNPASPVSVGTVNVTGNAVSLNDGAGTSATFNLAPVNAALSTTLQTNAGAYQLDGSGLLVTSNVNPNFSRLTVVGDLSVAPKTLTANANNATKVYDGTSSAAGVSISLSGVVTSGSLTDAVTAGGNGQFATRNAGATTYSISNLALTGSDASNYQLSSAPLSGTGTITPKAVTFSAPTGTKIYDGQTTYTVAAADLTALSAALGVAGDTVSAISFNFDNKNVGTGKTLTPSAAVVADGNGGGNYNITYASNAQSSITRLNSVTWAGGASGNWFDPANWAGGAVPDLSNVANVVIPSGVTVSFGSTVVAPAQSGAVNIDGLTGAGGNLSQSAGTLNVGTGGIVLSGLTQSGGTLTNAGPTTLDSFNQSGGSFAGTGNMSAGSFVQTGGATTLAGNLTVTQNFSQGPTGSVSVGDNVSITDTTGGVQLGNLTSTGTLGVTSTDGAITQANGTAITAQSTSNFTATQGGAPADISLGNAGNDFVGAVTLNGRNVTIVDANSLTLGTVTAAGNLNATAATNLAVNGVVNANTLDLTATTGNITQGANGTLTVVTGPTNLTAGGNVTLGGANDFNGAVNATGNNITLNDVNSLTLGNVTAAGNLNATAATDLAVNGVVNANTLDLTATTGNITQGANGTLTVATGPTNLTAGGNVTLGGANDFNGAVNATGNNITLNDVNSLTLGNVTAAGNLNATAATNLAVNGVVNANTLDLTATTGNITQGANGTLTVATGPTNLTAGGNVTLGGANDFNGAVNATGNNITLNDVNSLTLGNVTAAGNLNATAATDLAVNGVVNANTLDLTATTGNITQGANGTLTVATGPTNLTAGGNITLGGANDFNGAVNATGNNITLNDVNSLTLGNVTATGNLNATAATNLAVNGVVNANTLDLTATTGNITQGANGTLTVATGPTNLTAGGNVTLGGANDFNGAVNATGNNITLNDVNSLTLGNVTATGNLNATAATNLAVNGVVNANTLDLTATTGNITQGANGTLTVATGPTNLTAGGNVTLGGANDFNGTVNATGNNITLNDVNSLTLGNVTAAGNLNATAATNLAVNGVVNANTLDLTATTGNITQGANGTLTVATGPTNLTAGGNVTLGGANDFNGAVNATGNNITLNDVNSLTLGNVTATGNLNATAATNLAVNGVVNANTLDLTATTGNITQGANGTLTVATGPTNLTAGGNITLGGANDFNGAVNATGNNITLNDVNNLTLGNVAATGIVNATGKLDATAVNNLAVNSVVTVKTLELTATTGNITQPASSSMTVTSGPSNLTAGGTINLEGTNNFTGVVNKSGGSTTRDVASKVLANNPTPVVLGTSLSNANIPQPLVLSASTQTLVSKDSSSSASNSAGSSQASGISIEQRNAPSSTGLSMMFAVSLPKGTSTVGTGFSFDLPESVKNAAANSADIRANLANGATLPAWLKFDAKTLRFDANAVPDGAFPLQVALTFGGQRTLVVISERAD